MANTTLNKRKSISNSSSSDLLPLQKQKSSDDDLSRIRSVKFEKKSVGLFDFFEGRPTEK